MMEIFHTSPVEIKEVSREGLFGSHLFFASKPYYTTAAPKSEVKVYRITLAEEDVIEASRIFYHEEYLKVMPVVREVMESFGVSEGVAMDLLDGSTCLSDVCPAQEADGFADWKLQKLTAQAGKRLGYRAVEVRDEQGSAWMVDMFGRENELILCPHE